MMNFVLYTTCLSPHQLPLANELASTLGVANFVCVVSRPLSMERISMGWGTQCETSVRVIEEWADEAAAKREIMSADVVMCGLRDMDMFKTRCKSHLTTIYSSERWFKPWLGIMRLAKPSYFMMAWRFVKLLRSSDRMYYYPIGIHAARDMARLVGLFSGDIRCLFRAPELDFERKSGGKIWLKHGPRNTQKYCLDRMRMWGYYVEPSKFGVRQVQEACRKDVRILWVGRLLRLKRVETIVRAVKECANLKRDDASLPRISLDIYGAGPDEARLKRMSNGYEELIRFYPPVSIAEVRRLMHEHDVYVLASNGHEGWGAVVSEALEEGMRVIGTYEAGSSATILPDSNLFHAGDWASLGRLIRSDIHRTDADLWTAEYAAKWLLVT